MSADGKRRQFNLEAQPPETAGKLRRVIATFLGQHALPVEVEEELDAPGRTVEQVEDLTAASEADIEVIAAMPSVTFVAL